MSKVIMSRYHNHMYDLSNIPFTNQEFNDLVSIVAKIFIGKELVIYVVKAGQEVGYLPCDFFDSICKEYSVSIDNKSSIKRVSFEMPKDDSGINLDIKGIKEGSYNCFRLLPTVASKQDAKVIFPYLGIFDYIHGKSECFMKYVVQLIDDYLMNKNYNRVRGLIGFSKAKTHYIINGNNFFN